MELLVLSNSRGVAGRIRIGFFSVIVVALVGIASGAGLGYCGYILGADAVTKTMLLHSPENPMVWQKEILSQRRFLNRLQTDLEADLSALSGSVGILQGDVSRLNAVADRVAKSVLIDPEEFVFGAPVPVGGPEKESLLAEQPSWRSFLENLTEMEKEIAVRDSRLTVLESLIADLRYKDMNEPGGKPLIDGWISSGYGYRTDPLSGKREFHGGIDFAGKLGSQIKAVADGVVTWSGGRWGYGNMVELNHGNGYVTRYAHNKSNLVKIGEKVTKNQPIALVGSSGRSTGPHVHFEVLRGDRTVDPLEFISRYGR